MDRSWFADITVHPTSEGKLYVCVLEDACSNRIVSLSTRPRITSDLARNTLRYAIAARSPVGTIVHSERGAQFRSRAFATTLRSAGLHGRIGRAASAADNAAMESFFALMQTNALNRRRWDTRKQLRLAIRNWIQRDYHRRRRQAALAESPRQSWKRSTTLQQQPNQEGQRNSVQSPTPKSQQYRPSGGGRTKGRQCEKPFGRLRAMEDGRSLPRN